ncbi:MAG: hypothetical protein K0Q55_1751 [Verrucomicrobia bacterium]|nr:hypothetical protein [Verrucomicrobiota bacterium]
MSPSTGADCPVPTIWKLRRRIFWLFMGDFASPDIFRFEELACAEWFSMKVVHHQNEGHILLSNGATRDRMKALVRYFQRLNP